MTNISNHELRLISRLLELTAGEFVEYTDNNFDLRPTLSLEQCEELQREFQKWCNVTKEYHKEQVNFIDDWLLMSFFAGKLKTIADE